MTYTPKSTISAATERALRQQAAEREAREETERREQAGRDRENSRVRGEYLAGLEAKKAEKRAAVDAEVDQAIAPERGRLEREWIANHPGKSGADFAKHAWPQLRPTIIEGREEAQREALRREMQASGRYAL